MLEQRQTYRINLDLLGFPWAEEVEVECQDGKTRLGAFIPYDENNVYATENRRWVTMVALAVPEALKKTPSMRGATHTIMPFWTVEQKRRWQACGFVQDRIRLGVMTIKGFWDCDMRRRKKMEEGK